MWRKWSSSMLLRKKTTCWLSLFLKKVRKLICSRKQLTISSEYVWIYRLSKWQNKTFPCMHLNLQTRGNKRPGGLNLSSILTSTIVWRGLQRLNIYQSTLRAPTHQSDSLLVDAIEWPRQTNAHRFYSMFSTIGASWCLIDWASGTNSRGSQWERAGLSGI